VYRVAVHSVWIRRNHARDFCTITLGVVASGICVFRGPGHNLFELHNLDV